MSKTLEFKAFCFEAYRADKKLSGREAMSIFKKIWGFRLSRHVL